MNKILSICEPEPAAFWQARGQCITNALKKRAMLWFIFFCSKNHYFLLLNAEERIVALFADEWSSYTSERLILPFSWNSPLCSPKHSHLHFLHYSWIAIVICVKDLKIIEWSLFLLKQEVIAFFAFLAFIHHEHKGKKTKIKVSDFFIEELSVSMIYITVLLLERYQFMSVK